MFIKLCDKTIMIFIFLVLIVLLLDRNSKTHKNVGRKNEVRETNFRDGANFNNFR